MTEQEKDRLVARMLDAPSSLSEEELDMIMLDDELKDIYEMSSAVKGACSSMIEIDAEKEWTLFRRRIIQKPSPIRWMMRVAAIFLGIMLVSGIIVKIVDHSLKPDDKLFVAEAVHSLANHHATEVCADNNVSEKENVTVDVVETGRTSSVTIPVSSNASKPISEKEEVEEEIDIDEYLRRQQDEIDYEIALLNADVFLDEHNAMREFMDCLNGDNINEADANIIIL